MRFNDEKIPECAHAQEAAGIEGMRAGQECQGWKESKTKEERNEEDGAWDEDEKWIPMSRACGTILFLASKGMRDMKRASEIAVLMEELGVRSPIRFLQYFVDEAIEYEELEFIFRALWNREDKETSARQVLFMLKLATSMELGQCSIDEAILGLKHGLSEKEVKKYVKVDNTPEEMRRLRREAECKRNACMAGTNAG